MNGVNDAGPSTRTEAGRFASIQRRRRAAQAGEWWRIGKKRSGPERSFGSNCDTNWAGDGSDTDITHRLCCISPGGAAVNSQG